MVWHSLAFYYSISMFPLMGLSGGARSRGRGRGIMQRRRSFWGVIIFLEELFHCSFFLHHVVPFFFCLRCETFIASVAMELIAVLVLSTAGAFALVFRDVQPPKYNRKIQ